VIFAVLSLISNAFNSNLVVLRNYMISNGIRGRIATVPNRFARANNKYMGEAYESRWKPTKFITLSRYKQALWLGNESAITNTWFSMDE